MGDQNTKNQQIADAAAARAVKAQENSFMGKQKKRLVDESRIPGFTGNQALDGGKLRSDLQLGAYDPRGIEAIRGEALRTPGQDSPWATMMKQKQGFEQQQGLNSAANQWAGAQAGASANLAMRGGMASGARNRLAAQGMKDQALGAQGIRAQGNQQRMDIGIEDEQNRQKWLSGLAGQEAAYQAPQKTNIENTLSTLGGEANRKGVFDMAKYGLENEALSKLISGTAAEKAASSSGKK
jgi:hypothetical protein